EGDRKVLEHVMAEAEAASDDPAEQLVAFLRAFETAADDAAMSQPGCLFVSFVYEQVPDTDAVRPVSVEAIQHWRARIADKLVQARDAGRLDADTDVESLADHVFTTFEGAFILARATGHPDHVRAQLGHLRRYFELLLE